MSLCKVSRAPRLLAACCTWSTRKSSLGFFSSDGPGVGSSSLTQLMGLMGFSWFLGFALPLPDINLATVVLETLLRSGFFEVSSSNDVLSTAAAKPLAATHATPQQSCCVWFSLTIDLESGYTISASHWEPIGLCSGNVEVNEHWFVFLSNATRWAAQTVLCLSVDGNRNYLLPTNDDDVDWKPWIEIKINWTPISGDLVF